MRHIILGLAVGGILLSVLVSPPAAPEETVRYVNGFSEEMVPIWRPDGTQSGAVAATTFGSHRLPIKEERNGYYLIDHPDEGPVFVPGYAVELDRSRSPSRVPCDVLGSFASRSTSGLGAGEDCPR